MTLDEYNGFCASLPSDHPCRAVGRRRCLEGRRQGVCNRRLGSTARPHVTFKCSDLAYDILKDQPGCGRRPISPRAA